MQKQHRAADLRPASFNPADNTVEVVWTTGASVRRRDYRRDVVYDEVLEVTAQAVRLDRLNAGAPLLDTHNDSKLAAIIGSVVPGTARIENGLGVARVKLSSAEVDADVVGKIKDGIIRNISVGYTIHRWRTAPGDGGAEETRTAVDWEPLELSAVPVPADAGAHFRDLRDDSPQAARARMQARQAEVGLSAQPDAARARMRARQAAVAGPRLRRATLDEVRAMGRISWHIPDESWPMVECGT